MNSTSKKGRVRYYVPEDYSEEVVAEIKSKLVTFDRNQLEMLICVLSQEIARLEHQLESSSSSFFNSDRQIFNSDSQNVVTNQIKLAQSGTCCQRIIKSMTSLTQFETMMSVQIQKKQDIATEEALLSCRVIDKDFNSNDEMSCDRQHNSCRHNNVDLQKHTDIDIQSDNNIDLQLACHEHEPHDTTYTQKGTAFKMKDSVQAKHPQLDTVYDKTIYNKTVNDSSIDSLQSNDSFNPLFQQTTILPLNKVNVVLPICLNNNFVQNNKIQESDPNKAIKIMKQSSSVRVENIPLEIVKDTLMESFHCTLCQLEFSSDLILTHHMKTSHKYATYSCIFCGKSFTYKHNLKIHQRNKHNRTTVLCSYCGKLVLQTRLDVHMEKVHEKPLFTCHICQKGFLKRECLEGHVNKHCNTKPYICEFCGRKYAYSTSLCSHKKRCVKASMPTHLQHPRSIDKKGTSYICEICGVKFEGISGLKDHLGAKHSNKSQHCSFCAKSFQWRPSYNRHVKKCKDRTELERERCKHLLCDKFGGKQFVCVCGKQYPYRQSYRRHERNCHQKQEMESYMTDPPVG